MAFAQSTVSTAMAFAQPAVSTAMAFAQSTFYCNGLCTVNNLLLWPLHSQQATTMAFAQSLVNGNSDLHNEQSLLSTE
jgi:hypothetical protein